MAMNKLILLVALLLLPGLAMAIDFTDDEKAKVIAALSKLKAEQEAKEEQDKKAAVMAIVEKINAGDGEITEEEKNKLIGALEDVSGPDVPKKQAKTPKATTVTKPPKQEETKKGYCNNLKNNVWENVTEDDKFACAAIETVEEDGGDALAGSNTNVSESKFDLKIADDNQSATFTYAVTKGNKHNLNIEGNIPLKEDNNPFGLAINDAMLSAFSLGVNYEFVKTNFKKDKNQLDKNDWTWTLGLKANAGYDDFEFFTADSIETTKTSSEVWSLGINTTFLIPDIVVLNLGYEVQRGYTPAAEIERCAITATGLENCITAQTGAPTKDTKRVVTLELRQKLGQFPFQLTATRDLERRSTSVSLPIYVLQKDDKNDYSGGFKIEWDDINNEIKTGLFGGTLF